MVKKGGFFLFILVVAGAAMIAGASYVRSELRTPFPEAAASRVVDVPRGLGTRGVLRFLKDQNVIHNQYVALAYLLLTGRQSKLKAGEYLFDQPMTLPQVLDKLVNGTVYLHKFTVPEGLTIAETAQEWEKQDFGPAAEFASAAESSVDLIQRFDDKASSVEGYLFPETYSFPSRTTARQAIEAMVNRFGHVVEDLKKAAPAGEWPLKLRDTVVLASLVETEAARSNERPIIASVYLNRLNRRILLQCDPTVIYALERAGRYRGTLLLADLKFESPYNTYRNPGLPPGPIANPGYAALLAAVQPAPTNYLFFVRTVDGMHTFSETLAAHNRAVAAYRALKRSKGHSE